MNYFKYEDFLITETGQPNTVSSCTHLANIACLWDYLNSLRENLGQAICINSAFRTPEINKQVGGAKRSLHMQGRAADIRTSPHYMPQLRDLCESAYNNGDLSEYISYPTFIHIAI